MYLQSSFEGGIGRNIEDIVIHDGIKYMNSAFEKMLNSEDMKQFVVTPDLVKRITPFGYIRNFTLTLKSQCHICDSSIIDVLCTKELESFVKNKNSKEPPEQWLGPDFTIYDFDFQGTSSDKANRCIFLKLSRTIKDHLINIKAYLFWPESDPLPLTLPALVSKLTGSKSSSKPTDFLRWKAANDFGLLAPTLYEAYSVMELSLNTYFRHYPSSSTSPDELTKELQTKLDSAYTFICLYLSYALLQKFPYFSTFFDDMMISVLKNDRVFSVANVHEYLANNNHQFDCPNIDSLDQTPPVYSRRPIHYSPSPLATTPILSTPEPSLRTGTSSFSGDTATSRVTVDEALKSGFIDYVQNKPIWIRRIILLILILMYLRSLPYGVQVAIIFFECMNYSED